LFDQKLDKQIPDVLFLYYLLPTFYFVVWFNCEYVLHCCYIYCCHCCLRIL